MAVVLSGSLFPVGKCTRLQKLSRYHTMVNVNDTQLLQFSDPGIFPFLNCYLTYLLSEIYVISERQGVPLLQH